MEFYSRIERDIDLLIDMKPGRIHWVGTFRHALDRPVIVQSVHTKRQLVLYFPNISVRNRMCVVLTLDGCSLSLFSMGTHSTEREVHRDKPALY